jgi:hypothetical protein
VLTGAVTETLTLVVARGYQYVHSAGHRCGWPKGYQTFQKKWNMISGLRL